jgi:hypothetical protein
MTIDGDASFRVDNSSAIDSHFRIANSSKWAPWESADRVCGHQPPSESFPGSRTCGL